MHLRTLTMVISTLAEVTTHLGVLNDWIRKPIGEISCMLTRTWAHAKTQLWKK